MSYEESLFKGAEGKLFYFARDNRKSQTQAEELLWSFLRNRNLNGFKFRRQHPISNFIADFYCSKCKLVIEIDGGYHDDKSQAEYDEGRTFELNELKVKVIRFTNQEVLNRIEFVVGEIAKHLSKD